MTWGPPLVNVYGMISGLGQTFENAYDKSKLNADQAAAGQTALQSLNLALQPTQTGAPNLASALMSSAQTQTQQGLNQGTQGPGAGLNTAGKIPSFIQQAADATGVSPTYLTRTAQIESGMNPNAHNPSGADGLFQFVPSTAKQYGVNTRDPLSSAMGAARLASNNGNVLRSALGRDPTDGELYLAHQQGAGGATRLLANPSAPAESIVGRAAVVQNGGRPGMTAGEFASLWTGKFGGGQPMAMPQGGTQVAQAPMPPPRPQGIQIASADPNFAPQMPAAAANMTPAQILVSRAQQGGGATFPSANNPQGVRGTAAPVSTSDDEEGGTPAPTRVAQAAPFVPGSTYLPANPVQYGQAGAPPSQMAPNPLAGMNPQQLQILRQQVANPVTREGAIKQIQALTAPETWKVEEKDGNLYRFGSRGSVQHIGQAKADQWSLQTGADGNQYWTNPQTRQMIRATQGKQFTDITDPRERQAAGLGSYNGPVQRGPDQQLHLPGKATTEVNVNQTAEKTYDQELGKANAKFATEIQEAERAATKQRTTLGVMAKLLDNPNFYSGLAGENVTAFRRGLASLGVADAYKAAPNELFESLSNQFVLDKAGGSLGAGISNADRSFIASTKANVGNTTEGNRLMIGLADRLAEREQVIGKMSRQYAAAHGGRLDAGFNDVLAEFAEKNPVTAGLQIPQQPTAQRDAGSGQPKPASPGVPQIGDVRRGYRFKGGDPASRDSWAPVQ